MKKAFSNPCSRCGTERIVLKTWKSKVGNSTIINVDKICPNPDCQKRVDSDNKKIRDKQIAMKLQSKKRMENRIIGRKANHK